MHRKIVSLTTTFSAILILLLHAVVPHHHYDDQLCAIFSPVGHETCTHTHAHADGDHHCRNTDKNHPQRNASDCCEIAEKIVFLPVSQRTHIVSNIEEEAAQEHFSKTDTPLLQSRLFLSPPGSQFVKRKQYQVLAYDETAACHKQLRAPPAC